MLKELYDTDTVTAITIAEQVYKQIEKSPNDANRRIPIKNSYIYLGSYKQTERNENQDRVICAQISGASKTDVVVVAIADGMGGLEHGAIAASDTLSYYLSCIAINYQKMNFCDCVKKAILFADEMVYKKYKRKAGSTLASIVYSSDGLIYANVGDSRIYQMNSSDIVQISQDDSQNALLATTRQGTGNVPARERLFEELDNRLIQHIGIGEGLEPHVCSMPPHDDFNYTNFLLTTDGVHYLGRDLLRIIISKSTAPEDIVKRCASIADWLGGHDNATIALAPRSLDMSFKKASNRGIVIDLYSHVKCSSIIIVAPNQNVGHFDSMNMATLVPNKMSAKSRRTPVKATSKKKQRHNRT